MTAFVGVISSSPEKRNCRSRAALQGRARNPMLETFHWFSGEGFGLIEDLLALLPDQGVIAEAFRLRPHLVKPLLDDLVA
jgi:hypothetical protein